MYAIQLSISISDFLPYNFPYISTFYKFNLWKLFDFFSFLINLYLNEFLWEI